MVTFDQYEKAVQAVVAAGNAVATVEEDPTNPAQFDLMDTALHDAYYAVRDVTSAWAIDYGPGATPREIFTAIRTALLNR